MKFDSFFSSINLTKTPIKKGIHFEQKITPDLLWCISQVLFQITLNNKNLIFTDKDVRKSEIFNSLMVDYFSKPVQSKNTENEYNKVSSYQLGFLSYCEVIEEVVSRPLSYRIKNFEILEDLAKHELYSLYFLTSFVAKFIVDNELDTYFEDYRKNQSQNNYLKAKEAYWFWAKKHTNVRTENPRHSNRVFNKIFNIYAYANLLKGQSGAKIIEGKCPYNFLIYKRINFRDVVMPRGLSRNEFLKIEDLESILERQERQVKKEVRDKHPLGEIQNVQLGYVNNRNFQCHHILPRNEFKNLMAYRENIIILTPDQHISFAHDKGTNSINERFQVICLIYKLQSIENSLINLEKFYNYKNYVEMINILFKEHFEENSPLQNIKIYLNNNL